MSKHILFLTIILLEVITGTSLFSAETVKIASIHAFSGAASISNRASSTGVRLGVEEINRRGGILGHAVELIELDNKSTPIGSKVAAKQAVDAKVVAIVGPSWSSHAIAAARVAQDAAIPMIATDATHEKVTQIGNYIFRVCYTDSFQGRAMAKFAIGELGAKTASILIDTTSDYSIGLADVFSRSFESLGGRVDTQVGYKYNQDHYRKELETLKHVASDILFIPGHDESAAIIIEAVKVGIKGIPIGCDGWSTSDFFVKGGSRVPLGYYSTHWSEEIQSPGSQQFVQNYKNGNYALSSEPLGYDAVLLLADAVARAGTLRSEQLRTALQKTAGFQGITGSISFDEFGDPVKTMVVMKIDQGKAVYLKSIAPQLLPNSGNGGQTEAD